MRSPRHWVALWLWQVSASLVPATIIALVLLASTAHWLANASQYVAILLLVFTSVLAAPCLVSLLTLVKSSCRTRAVKVLLEASFYVFILVVFLMPLLYDLYTLSSGSPSFSPTAAVLATAFMVFPPAAFATGLHNTIIKGGCNAVMTAVGADCSQASAFRWDTGGAPLLALALSIPAGLAAVMLAERCAAIRRARAAAAAAAASCALLTAAPGIELAVTASGFAEQLMQAARGSIASMDSTATAQAVVLDVGSYVAPSAPGAGGGSRGGVALAVASAAPPPAPARAGSVDSFDAHYY